MSGSDSEGAANKSADQPAEPDASGGEPPARRTRARVKPPAVPGMRGTSPLPQTTPPVFVPKNSATGDDSSETPRIDPELGLGWLQEPETAGEDGPKTTPSSPKVRPPRKPVQKIQADLTGRQQVQGQHVGDRYVRVVRQQSDDFERAGPGHLVATEEAMEARGPVGRVVGRVKRALIGAPLTTAAAAHERLTKVKALAVLSSDALSSVAYATEEILRVLLIAAGLARARRQPADRRGDRRRCWSSSASPTGRRSRPTRRAAAATSSPRTTWASWPALTAGAALLIDYILTVAVSIAAGGRGAGLGRSRSCTTTGSRSGIGFIAAGDDAQPARHPGVRHASSPCRPTSSWSASSSCSAIGFVRNALDGFAVQEPPPEADELAGGGRARRSSSSCGPSAPAARP